MILRRMSLFKKAFPAVLLIFFCFQSYGQQMPFNPVSYRIFTPFILNPAAAGSKDYLSVDMLAGFNGKSASQILSTNSRITRRIPGINPSGKKYFYTDFGIGASAFNDFQSADSTHNAGISLSGSYHIPLNKRALSFLSVGASLKGLYHFHEGNAERIQPSKEFYYPEFDMGLYIYNPKAYAGLSATNLLGRPKDTVNVSPYIVPVSRQYNFIAGYKFVISKSMNLVFEPSLLIHTDDSLSFSLKKNVEPALKLYAGDFLIGTYFNDYSSISFFFQYRYPKFYVGTFFALPKNSPFYKKSPTAEIAFGINFSRNKSGYTKSSHW